MSADPTFDQISATTLAEMERDVVYDNFFAKGAFQRIMRHYAQNDPFTGGLFMQEVFQYNRVNGGASTPGADRTVVQQQILAALSFTPREYTYDIPINEWQTEVINTGPAAAVSTYDAYMKNAVESYATDVNIDFYYHGQAASTAVLQDRSIYINGADEALSNGVDPGFLGNVYTSYGNQLRNGAVSSTINSGVYWAGDQAGNVGPTNYATVLDGYLACVQPPDTALGNKAVFGQLLKRIQPQQSFVEETMSASKENDARIGMTGVKILEMFIHVDKLAPSTKFGALLPTGLSQSMSLALSPFTTPATVSSASGYPASTSCKPGEPLFLLRLQDWKLRPAASPRYNHHFGVPVYSQSNADMIVMFYQNALNCYTPSPRDNWQIVGFGQ
jgi:hypothetical protein